jgi:predicted SprT family Zn-dependent metalloprotease
MQPMRLSESRSEPKTPANMPSLRQLEFAFEQFAIRVVERDDAVTGQAFHLPALQTATEAVAIQLRGRDGALETEARELLRSLGAKRIATELCVEWNPRLKTAAGRADFRDKSISLNPRLVEHPGEIDRTLRHELAHILAQFRAGRRRISPHGPEWQQACRDLGIAGEKRSHTLPFPAKRYAPRFIYRCPNCRRDFPRVRKLKRIVACLACCRAHNRGEFDVRFRLKIMR